MMSLDSEWMNKKCENVCDRVYNKVEKLQSDKYMNERDMWGCISVRECDKDTVLCRRA